MFSRNFIIYCADVTVREPSKFYNSAEQKVFLELGLRNLYEEIYPRSVWDLECEPRNTHLYF